MECAFTWIEYVFTSMEHAFTSMGLPPCSDPQIYNEGVGEQPPWWRRLWAWLWS
jgi:hypothetical protein